MRKLPRWWHSVLLWLLVIAALFAALLANTPFGHRARELLLVAVCASAGALLACTWRAWRRRSLRLPSLIRAALLLLAAGYAGSMEIATEIDRARVLSTSSDEIAAVGRHVMVGYKDVARVRELAARGAIGGVFITTRNLEHRSLDTLRRELGALQTLRRARGLPPLLVAADQEGGVVSRLSPWLTALPPLAELAMLAPAARRRDEIRRYARVHGQELSALGVKLNFGPVVDLRAKRQKGSADLYSKIPRRAIHHDPARVREVAHVYARELRAHGVIPTFKHFPGLGRVAADTHFFAGRLEVSLETLRAHDWVPYRQLGARSAVMLGHVRLTDGQLSSTSAKAVSWLRRDLGAKGMLITDDLCMVPAWLREGGMGESAVQALNAGVDMLLVALDPRQVYGLLDALLEAQVNGRLSTTKLHASVERIDLLTPELALASSKNSIAAHAQR